jgi:glycerol-3-phosphate acyltransferase PlsY
MNFLTFLVCVVAGYLAGSIPTAYLFVRIKAGADLRFKGSGNIGALNVYNVTGSKWTGIIVGLIDAIKGFLVAWSAWYLTGSFWAQSAALSAAILGHNYPVWLRFRGGRGLAAAAGGMFGMGVGYTAVWCLVWFVIFRMKKSVIKANFAAVVLTPFILIAVPSSWISAVLFHEISATDYIYFSFILSGILCLKHIREITGVIRVH